jgi:hypothetical protein
LSAVSIAYAATGDARMMERMNYIVDELAICRQANTNGYVATMLLTAGSRWQNSGVKWNERRTLWTQYGKRPTLIEPVKGWLTLHEIEGAVGMQLIPLDGAARPIGEPLRGRRLEGGWEIPLGNPATTWYLIRVIRSTAPTGGK